MRLCSALLLLCLSAAPAAAQRADARFAATGDSARGSPSGWSGIRIAKWSTLAAAGGAIAYGFTQNRSADREYADMERLCEETPAACATTPAGAYQDASLEQRYRDVLRRDDRARLALLLGEIGIAASVVLFILDLPQNGTPQDIPYDPRALRIGLAPGGNGIAVRIPLR